MALTLSDIDTVEKEITVNKNLSRENTVVTPKTKAGYRSIPINDELISVLKPFLEERKPGERVFTWRSDSVVRYYKSFFNKMGMPYSGYILRHTFITNCYELGISPYIVKIWVGHSKIEQADVYLALRKQKDFIKTPAVKYMLKLKRRVMPLEGISVFSK